MRRWSGRSASGSAISAGDFRFTASLFLAAWLAAAPAAAAERPVLDGLAEVLTDASLRINGRTVSLYGVFVPNDARTCSTVIRPARCGTRSALVLEQRVQGFVRCEIVGRAFNGSLAGICTVQGRDIFGPRIDLGASLVADGWALADEGAPARYRALERLARRRGIGLWDDGITIFR